MPRPIRIEGEECGCNPDYCASSKAKRLKQLRAGSTESIRAERGHRPRVPLALLNPFSSSTSFHHHKKLGCAHAREGRVGAEQLGCALSARAPRFTASQSLCVLKTHKTYRLAFVETLLKFRYRRLARVNPRIGTEFRLRPGLWAACRRRAGRAGQAVPCKQLRAFTSVCMQLRAFASGFERARSRLVAFSRAKFFFFVFGHVRARLGVFFRHFSSFFVILRPKMAFSGMAGNGLLRHRLGREGSSLLRMVPAPGAGWAKWHRIHLKSVYSCGRAAAAFVYVQHNCTTKSGRLQLLEIPGCISEWGWVSDLL